MITFIRIGFLLLIMAFFSGALAQENTKSVKVQVQSDDKSLEYKINTQVISIVESSGNFHLSSDASSNFIIKIAVASVKNGNGELIGAAIALLALANNGNSNTIISTFSNEVVSLDSLELKIKEKILLILQ